MSPFRDELMSYLNSSGIESRAYYPVPLHMQKCYAGLGYKKGELAVSESVCDEIFSVPIYPELTGEEINEIIYRMKKFFVDMHPKAFKVSA